MRPDLAEIVECSDVAGCAVGVLAGGQDPEFIFHGSCSIDGSPISAMTLWEAASLSKPVVSLLAAHHIAHDPDLLTTTLSADLDAFGVDDDERWGAVSLAQLLTHSAGLPNWRHEGQRLHFESAPDTPGYSGEGYELVLLELSARAGVNVDHLLAHHLQNLGMENSSFTPDPATPAEVAIGHDASGRAVPKTFPSRPAASGSLHTTVEDYTRFLAMIARPGTLDADRRDAARIAAERQIEILPGHGRTIGWAFDASSTDGSSSKGDVLWQHGDNPGFKHVAAVRPATGDALLVLTNDDGGQLLYRQLCREFLHIDVW